MSGNKTGRLLDRQSSAGYDFFSGDKNEPVFWQIFWLAFLLLVFYLPFGVAFNFSPEIDLASIRVLIVGFFLIWLVGTIFFKRDFFVSNFQGFGLIVFLLMSAASLFFASELGWGGRKLAVFLSIFPLYYMTASFLTKAGRFKKLADILIGSAVISALLGLVQFLSQFLLGASSLVSFYTEKIGPFFWGQAFSSLVEQNPSWFFDAAGQTLMRAFGLFPDPHMLSFFLGLVAPLVLARFLFSKNHPLWFLSAYLLLAVVLLLTFSRGGYLGFFLSLIMILGLAWRFLNQRKRFLILTILLLGLLLLIIFGQSVVSRFVSSFLLAEGSSIGRLAIWQDSWRVFLNHPFLGVGLGNYPREIEPLVPYRSPITSHNLYLDIAAETGIFGLATWGMLFLGSLFQLLRSLAKNRLKEFQGTERILWLNIGLIGSLSYFCVHSFFETAIFNPVVLAALMIIFGLTSASLSHEHLA